MNNIKGLLTEIGRYRELLDCGFCTKKPKSDISRYRVNKRGQ